MGVELVVATCLAGGAGYWADNRWGTLPWLTVLGVIVGTAAGIRNVLRMADQMERQQRSREAERPANEAETAEKPEAEGPGAD